MSANLQAANIGYSPSSHPAKSTPKPYVHVIPGASVAMRRSAWPYILLVVVLVVLMVGVPMVINTQMAQRAYEIRDQQVALSELRAEGDALAVQLLAEESPASLEAKAQALGLVPSGHIGAISLKESTVKGGEAAQ